MSQVLLLLVTDTVAKKCRYTIENIRPYPTTKHDVVEVKYETSDNPKGYISVYQYLLNGELIMLDKEDGYILWSSLWKVNVATMLKMEPDIGEVVRTVKHGLTQIRGTWMPYEVVLSLALRAGWSVKEELVPLFGPGFVTKCLRPIQPNYRKDIYPGDRRRYDPRCYDHKGSKRQRDMFVYVRFEQKAYGRLSARSSCDAAAAQPYSVKSQVEESVNLSKDGHFRRRRNEAQVIQDTRSHQSSFPVSRSQNEMLLSIATRPSIQNHIDPNMDVVARTSYSSCSTAVMLPPISTFNDLRHFDLVDAAAVLYRLTRCEDE
ncbi:hypothetical protein GG344DRAFT_68604 [Lentinula edodes]|nr:hypothetical protein GG344DRAFT_68604 [Lentinula edodes]